MPVATKHSLFGVQYDTHKIGGVGTFSARTGAESRGEPADGAVYNSVAHLVSQVPSLDFTSFALNTVLSALGIDGAAVASATPVTFFGQKHAEGGTRAGSTSHKKFVVNEGIIFASRISVQHLGDATINVNCLITYDGTNLPYVVTEDQSLTSGFTDLLRFTMGPWDVDGIELTGIRSVEIDFGVRATQEGADSDIFPTFSSIETIQPTITWRGVNLAWFKTSGGVPMAGLAAEHANTIGYFRKRAAAGPGFVADGTAEHVKVTAAGCLYVVDVLSASGSQAGECSLMLRCNHDGTNLPLVFTVDSAIT